MKSIIIYQSHFDLIENLTDEEAGILIKVIGKYSHQLTQNNPNGLEITHPLIKGIFMMMKRDFDIQHENYEKKCETNKKNGSLGGRPKKQENPNGFVKTHTNPENLKDKDKDKVILDTISSTSSSSSNEFYNVLDYTNKPTPDIDNVLDNLLLKLSGNGK